jgi:ribonuclease Z
VTLPRILTGILVIAIACVIVLWNSRSSQGWILDRAVNAALAAPTGWDDYDGLRVFLCGTSSPLPDPERAQACVAVFAGESVFIVDAGAGSATVATLSRLPLERLGAIFLTHYHSDHIAAIPEFNLNSWVAGRTKPLQIIGPPGVTEVVDGLNAAYRLDSSYRVLHHGADLLAPELGIMDPSLMAPGSTRRFADLSVRSYLVNHDPIRPAVAYRFDYRGRSVVVSGDTIVNDSLIDAATGADLLIQDALSPTIVQAFERASAGTRLEKIFHDIQDYHASTEDLARLVAGSGVQQLALYHLVPPPRNALLAKIFERDLPEGTVLTRDRMIFELPAGSSQIHRIDP